MNKGPRRKVYRTALRDAQGNKRCQGCGKVIYMRLAFCNDECAKRKYKQEGKA